MHAGPSGSIRFPPLRKRKESWRIAVGAPCCTEEAGRGALTYPRSLGGLQTRGLPPLTVSVCDPSDTDRLECLLYKITLLVECLLLFCLVCYRYLNI